MLLNNTGRKSFDNPLKSDTWPVYGDVAKIVTYERNHNKVSDFVQVVVLFVVSIGMVLIQIK